MIDWKKLPRDKGLEFFVGLVAVAFLVLCISMAMRAYEQIQYLQTACAAGKPGVGPEDIVKWVFSLVQWVGFGTITTVYLIWLYGSAGVKFVLRLMRGEVSFPRPSELLTVGSESSEEVEMSKMEITSLQTTVRAVGQQLEAVVKVVNGLVDLQNRNDSQFEEIKRDLSKLQAIVVDLESDSSEYDERLAKLEPEPVRPPTPEEIQEERMKKLEESQMRIAKAINAIASQLNNKATVAPAPVDQPKAEAAAAE